MRVNSCCCFSLKHGTFLLLFITLFYDVSALGLSVGVGFMLFFITFLGIYGCIKEEPYLILPHIIIYGFHVFVAFLILLFLFYTYFYTLNTWVQLAVSSNLIHKVHPSNYEDKSELTKEDADAFKKILVWVIGITILYDALQFYFLLVQYSFYRRLLERRIVIIKPDDHFAEEGEPEWFTEPSMIPPKAHSPEQRILSWHSVPSFIPSS